MNGSNSPKILPSRPSTSGGTPTTSTDVRSTTLTDLTRPSTSCTCSSPPAVEDADIPPVPQLDPEATAKIPVLPVTPAKPTLNVVADPVSRQPSPMPRPEELELKEAYLNGYKQVEDFFNRLVESLNFYKRKSSALEDEVQQLKDAKAKLEERVRSLEEETQDWEHKREEHERRKEGRVVNKVKRFISVRTKLRTEGSTMPVTTIVEGK